MKLLCIIEATTVTGPAKNLLNFCRLMRAPEFSVNGVPRVEISIVTFDRVSETRAVATGSNDPSRVYDPVATTDPRGLPARGPRSARGSDTADVAPNAFVAAARAAGETVDVIHERFRFDPRVIKQLKTIVERRQPDIIQTHMIKSHFLVKLAGLRKTYPWVAYHHGYTATDAKMRVYNKLNRWSLPSATRVITVCDAFAKQLSENGVRADRIAVRHNAVVAPRQFTKDARQALKDELGIGSDDHVMLAVGRLSREKGHDDLIQAVATLRDSDSALKLKLVIVGDGPERSSLQQAVSQHGLDDQVIFIGHVSDVAPYYAITDVLALPSHSEGSPNVLLEAMAAGVPVVATRVGGVPEIASEENALLVAPRDPQAFAVALRRVLTETELPQRLCSNAQSRAREFSPESHAHSLIQIYEEILTEPRRVRVASGSQAQPCVTDPFTIAPGSDTV